MMLVDITDERHSYNCDEVGRYLSIVCKEVTAIEPVLYDGSADTCTDKYFSVMQLLYVTWCEPELKGYCSDLVLLKSWRASECGARGIVTFNQRR